MDSDAVWMEKQGRPWRGSERCGRTGPPNLRGPTPAAQEPNRRMRETEKPNRRGENCERRERDRVSEIAAAAPPTSSLLLTRRDRQIAQSSRERRAELPCRCVDASPAARSRCFLLARRQDLWTRRTIVGFLISIIKASMLVSHWDLEKSGPAEERGHRLRHAAA
uniref:Uncharacterized protein n=1 Tax=Oryza punctata TaxID=4537 RepID=A0A0E0LU74_ORYPU